MQLCEIGSSTLEAGAHASQSQGRCVVRTADMRQPEPAHAVWTPGTQNGISGLIVREMARATEDALFKMCWIGTAQEPLAIMIGLEDEQVGLPNHASHLRGYFAAIGHDTDATPTRAQQVAARGNRVVRYGKRCHLDITDYPPRSYRQSQHTSTSLLQDNFALLRAALFLSCGKRLIVYRTRHLYSRRFILQGRDKRARIRTPGTGDQAILQRFIRSGISDRMTA